MRTSAVFFAIATWLAHSSIAQPIDTSVIDGAVAQVDVPDQTIKYIDCDPRDPYCIFANHIGIHSVDDVTDHLGRQSEILSNSVANALDDESQPDLASSVRTTGQHTHEELSNSVGVKEYHARDGSITPPIKDELTHTISENDPSEPTFEYVGSTAANTGTLVGDLTGDDGKNAPLQETGLDVIGAQGKAISSLGGGVEGFGNEANRIFSDGFAPACAERGDCERGVNLIPDL